MEQEAETLRSTVLFTGSLEPEEVCRGMHCSVESPDGHIHLEVNENRFSITWIGENPDFRIVRHDVGWYMRGFANAQMLVSRQPLSIIWQDEVAILKGKAKIRHADVGRRSVARVGKRAVGFADEIWELTRRKPYLNWALEDYKKALEAWGSDAIYYSYRAVETVRNHFGEDKKSSWEAMRRSLNISEEYLKYLAQASTRVRHGARSETRAELVLVRPKECLTRSQLVLERFVRYLGSKEQTLDTTEYPLV